VEEEDPWNGGWAKDGEAEEPAGVAGASATGRKGTGRSEKAKVSEEAVRRKGGGGGPMERRMG
jgi:hypothetical protein